jgi:probable DNA repair protein
MYDWLNGALQGSSQVVTANRRLARVLAAEYSREQVAAGRTAWRSPRILSWQDWLTELVATAELSQQLPTRLNGHQSRILWERCLRREVTSPLLNISALVRQARDAWRRLHDYNVQLAQIEAAAQGRDQRIFASAARAYQSILEREHWIDDAALTTMATELVRNGHAVAADTLVFAGFDRVTPAAASLHEALRDCGIKCHVQQPSLDIPAGKLGAYENTDAEMRAAGSWARREILEDPSQCIAVITSQLERDAERSVRLLREGFVPGWQGAGDARHEAVNVSYGKRLVAYPVVAIAIHLLRWLHEDISSHDLSQLLRSPACGSDDLSGRSRLDLELRRLPAMSWSPERFLFAFERQEQDPSTHDWLERVRALVEIQKKIPARNAPSQWALLIDDTLRRLGWPGSAALNSDEFQLVNRWRELLNDFAKLELVSPTMSLGEALSRLQSLAAETVFQSESEGAMVQLLGPLEAAGMEFDKLWVAGLSAANWPPGGRPSPLISRSLQRDVGMPDATPADTLSYANRLLRRLAASTRTLNCSYPVTDGDAEQSPTGLIDPFVQRQDTLAEDPGWYVAALVHSGNWDAGIEDPVPPVTQTEKITGGAGTIQRQLADPFSAFAFGRLGIRPIQAFATGLLPNIRGSLIHDALHYLYRDLPARSDIVAWDSTQLEQRFPGALKKAFAGLERRADATLKLLLALEKQRVADLLRQVVRLDQARNEFAIASLETSLELTVDQVHLRLRIDRIDQLESGELVIIDYKTGQRRQFVNRSMEADDLQLVVYSCAASEPVAGLAYVNVDSRHVDLSGAGREFTPDLDWDSALSGWQQEVTEAVLQLQKGDIRLNGALPVASTRAFGLVSRIRELQRDS